MTKSGYSPFTLSTSFGSSEVVRDFQDMNGDGFPDIINKGNIQMTNSNGSFGENIAISAIQSSSNFGVSIGAGGTANFSKSINTVGASQSSDKSLRSSIEKAMNLPGVPGATLNKNDEHTVESWTDVW